MSSESYLPSPVRWVMMIPKSGAKLHRLGLTLPQRVIPSDAMLLYVGRCEYADRGHQWRMRKSFVSIADSSPCALEDTLA